MAQESPTLVSPTLVEFRLHEHDRAAVDDAACYRALFNSISQGFCVVEVLFDSSGNAVDLEHVAANPAFYKHSPLRDVVGRKLSELQPDIEAHWFDVYGKVARTGEPTAFTMRSDALGRVFEVEAFAIAQEDRNLVGILFSDVTDKVERERVVNASRQMLEEVLGKMPALVTVVRGSDLRIEFVNPAYQALAPDLTMRGRTLDELWPETGRNLRSICEEVLATGEPFEAKDDRIFIRRSSMGPLEEAYFDWSMSRIPLGGDAGQWGLLNVAWETTARHKTEASLRASELRYRQLFEQIPDGIFVANDQGRYVDVNPAGCALVGMTRDEVLNATFLDVLPPDEHVRLPEAIELLKKGSVIRSEWRFRRKDGSTFIGELTGRRNADGLLQGVLRDVTEAKRIEQARMESEQRFRVMADRLPLIVWVHDAAGELEYVNRTYCEYFGVTHEEAKGDRWRVLTHPDDGEAYVQEFLRCSAERRPFHGQARVRRADGEWRWIESWAKPRWAGEEFAGMVGTSADITERKQAAKALQEADRRKDEFLALLAHELRNPLAPIRTGLELLKLAKNNEEAAARTREVMERQVAYMTRLIDDLLDVSRIARGKLELRFDVCDLGEIVRGAIETSAPLIAVARHELTCSVPAGTYSVKADPVRLGQVFANVLNNAARYTLPGGRIAVDARAEGGDVVVTVADNGVGIPPDMLDRVFDAFTQVESPDRPTHGGLGLGLSLARSLVHLHDGSIKAESAGEGQGTTFTIRLPLVARSKATGDQAEGEAETGHPRRLLIVDDNRDAADSLGEVLRALGHEVRTSYSGEEALRTVEAYRPDVVLLDIGMPYMDGYEVARRLRARDATGRIVLVALTGYGQAADRQRTQAAGFDHHLVKPVDLKTLQGVLAATV